MAESTVVRDAHAVVFSRKKRIAADVPRISGLDTSCRDNKRNRSRKSAIVMAFRLTTRRSAGRCAPTNTNVCCATQDSSSSFS